MKSRDELKEMKKILVISNMYPSKEYPHYGVFVRNAAEILRNGGYQVTVCAIPKCDNRLLRLFAYGWAYTKCIFLGTFGKYDCLYAHFVSHTAVPARILKKIHPKMYLVENAHGNDITIQTEEDDGKNIERSRKILPLADRVIVPSTYFKDVVSNTFDYPSDKIFVSPSGGVNREILYAIDQKPARKQCGLETDAYYIGLIGRITSGKGWDTALYAIKIIQQKNLIPNLRLLIVGSGNQDELLEQELEKLDLKAITERRPFCAQKDLKGYFSSLNLFVFASESESESLGLVGLEAMACEAFCICSNNFGIATYATNEENCLMFEKGNVEQLAQTIENAFKISASERERIIQNGLKTAARYDRKVISEEFVQFFDGLLGKRQW